MTILGFDTATPSTVVGLLRGEELFEARHDPEPDERPGHATRLLGLVDDVLSQAAMTTTEVARIGVGTGPGSFTGLRIGIATAHGLAYGSGAELAGVSTLRALAEGVLSEGRDPATALPGEASLVAAVIDARRGETFAGAWRGKDEVMPASALAPEALADVLSALGEPVLAVGDGALRFRPILESGGAAIPPDGDPVHRVGARHVCRLGAEARIAPGAPVLPEYVRPPDAQARRPPETR
jgi:tRNA threonylcarbamoyladenosine biosynthesis protein TsaB